MKGKNKMTVIANPNLDHATLLTFEKNFERLAANKDTNEGTNQERED